MHSLSASRWPAFVRALTGLWLVTFLAFGPTLAAATLTVDDNAPANYSSITAALAAAGVGDTIQVAAGLYDESRETFPLALKNGVALVGAGRDVTTILAGATTSAFSNDGTPLSAATSLEGFTVTQEAGSDELLMEFLLGPTTMTPTIEGNRFVGNDTEGDGGMFIAADGSGGVFNGIVTGNEFLTFGSPAVAPVTTNVVVPEGGFGGGILLGRFFPIILDSLKSGGVKTSLIPTEEDQITPTISGNTFEGNAFGIAAIGSSYDDCSCEPSGIMGPSIQGNAFEENAIDNLLIYGGFGFRRFSPSLSNNTSVAPFVSIASFPFFFGGGPATAKTAKVASVPSSFLTMKNNIVEGRMGEGMSNPRPRTRAKSDVRAAGVAPGLPAVYDVTISGNTITDPLLAGMLFYQYMYAADTLEVNTEISGNTVTAPASDSPGGIIFGLFVDDLTTVVPGEILVERNVVQDASDSLVMNFGGSSEPPPPASAVKTAEAVAHDIQIVGNRLEDGEVGLTFSSDGYSTQAALVSCNFITGQSEAGVVIQEGSDPTPDFGGGARSSPGSNSIHDNFLNMLSEDLDLVEAENNFWGTTDPTAIDASIEGNVDFTPFLTAEPAGCDLLIPGGSADLSLAKQLLTPGPYAVGDDITYQLTATNNGPDAATDVVITDPIPEGMQFVSASAGCSASPTTVTCTAASITNTPAVFTITLQATMAGTFINTATVDSDETDPVGTNNTAVAPAVVVGPALISPIPTASEWGLMLMGVMLALVGVWFTRRA